MIDVIIPAYLPNKYYIKLLNRALYSLEQQTYKNFNVKIVFNGLFDEEKNIISSIAYNGNIEFYNLGTKKSAASGRNFAYNLCNKKYIAQLDLDDMFMPEKLEKQIYFMENNANIDVLGTLYLILANGKLKKSPYIEHQFETHQQIKNIILNHNVMCCGSILIKRSSLTKIKQLYNEKYKPGSIWPSYGKKMWEDWDLWIRMIQNGLMFHTLPERLYIWQEGTSVHKD